MSLQPEIREYNGKQVLFVDDAPFYAVAGEVHNSDSSSQEYMEGIWKIADELGLNTLLLPVTWELTEPEEGRFDFTVPDFLIRQARAWKKRIIFLWFGSWKNAEMMYAPAWVKTDRQRFHRAQIQKGKDKGLRYYGTFGVPYYSLSYLCAETMKADGKAYAALMAHLRDFDGEDHTVIGMQVENETGLLGAPREVSDEADTAFAGPAPKELIEWLRSHTDSMREDVREAVKGGAREGSWSQVFGPVAEEIFSAYYISRYVNYVAEKGRAEYALPHFANCWLVHKEDAPGKYPSGGPVTRMHEVWRFCAPAVDVLCPDIYVPEFLEVCDDYSRSQALMIPEAATHSYAAPRLAYCIGHYHAMGYSPFGFDDLGKPFSAVQSFLFGVDVNDPALKTPQNREEYAWFAHTLSALMPLAAPKYGTRDLQAVCAEQKAEQSVLDLGKLKVAVMFKNPRVPMPENGVALGLKTGEGEAFLLAYHCTLMLLPGDAANLDILEMEEGCFRDGRWRPGRRLNGDEVASLMFEEPRLLRVKVFTYDD